MTALSIGAPRAHPPIAIDAAAVAAATWRDGYFALPSVLDAALVARCHAAVAAAHAASVPTVAAFAYDAPWELAVALAPIVSAALGAPAVRQPAFWAWWVGGGGAPGGWAAHRDNPAVEVDERGAPDGLSVWVPVTDATADNGCMYVVPAPWDLQYQNPNATTEILSLQTVRALPAPAGSVLGWTPKLLHWGALARPGAPPRVSLSIEYQRADRPPIEATVAPLDEIPPPAARRAAIVEQWHRYRHMHEQDDDALTALTVFLDHTLPHG
ncbi:MAG: phytanoyl-CoA dioxygenase family protein [Myxococcales bacterium]|nr:phytanoyl-CoA dioxygenase family protein [Myxococcales bacterium]